MKIAVADSRFAERWNNADVDWEDFVKRLQKPVRTNETLAEYLALPKRKQANVKDVGGFVAGHLEEGRRRKGHVLSRSMIALDMDYAKPDTWLTLLEEVPWQGVAYTTHKHTEGEPRLRLVLPLAREISEEEYAPVARAVANKIGIDLFDDSTYEAQRLMYWPSASSDGEYVVQTYEGPLLDPDAALGEYKDWRDVTQWPLSSRQAVLPLPRSSRQEDPTAKEGLVGAFCRTYSVTEALEKFLPDTYAPTTHEDRWTYLNGESTNGVVIY